MTHRCGYCGAMTNLTAAQGLHWRRCEACGEGLTVPVPRPEPEPAARLDGADEPTIVTREGKA